MNVYVVMKEGYGFSDHDKILGVFDNCANAIKHMDEVMEDDFRHRHDGEWHGEQYYSVVTLKLQENEKDDELSPEMMELKDLLEKAQGVSEFWKDKMPMMACEEAGELIQAISKLERNKDSEVESTQRLYKKKLKEEITDMYISLMALQFHYGIRFSDVYEQMLKKLDAQYDEKGEKV